MGERRSTGKGNMLFLARRAGAESLSQAAQHAACFPSFRSACYATQHACSRSTQSPRRSAPQRELQEAILPLLGKTAGSITDPWDHSSQSGNVSSYSPFDKLSPRPVTSGLTMSSGVVLFSSTIMIFCMPNFPRFRRGPSAAGPGRSTSSCPGPVKILTACGHRGASGGCLHGAAAKAAGLCSRALHGGAAAAAGLCSRGLHGGVVPAAAGLCSCGLHGGATPAAAGCGHSLP